MKKKKKIKLLLTMLVFVLLVSNVLAVEERAISIRELQKASGFDKFLCNIKIKDCINSEMGKLVFVKDREQKIPEQTILRLGIRDENDFPKVVPDARYETTFKENTLIGFCALIQYEDPDNKCSANSFNQRSLTVTLNGKEFTQGVKDITSEGSTKAMCYVKNGADLLDSLGNKIKYSKAKADSTCNAGIITGTGINIPQGEKTAVELTGRDYVLNIQSSEELKGCSATPHWECIDKTQYKYQNADCTWQDTRYCIPKLIDGKLQETECSSDGNNVLCKATGSIATGTSNNGRCDPDETCDNTDCKFKSECQVICPDVVTYDVVEGSCQAVDCGAGEFKTLEECKDGGGGGCGEGLELREGKCQLPKDKDDEDDEDKEKDKLESAGLTDAQKKAIIWSSVGTVVLLIGIGLYLRLKPRRRRK